MSDLYQSAALDWVTATMDLRQIFERTSMVLRAAGLEHQARGLERCPVNCPPPFPQCVWQSLLAVQTTVKMEWGVRNCPRGTPLSAALQAVHLAEAAVVAIATHEEPPMEWLRLINFQLKELVLGSAEPFTG